MDMLGATMTSSGSTRSCEDTAQLEVVMEIAETQTLGVIGASATIGPQVEPLRPPLPHFPSPSALKIRGCYRLYGLARIFSKRESETDLEIGTDRMTTPHDFPELKNDLLLRAARGGVPIVC